MALDRTSDQSQIAMQTIIEANSERHDFDGRLGATVDRLTNTHESMLTNPQKKKNSVGEPF